MVTLRRTRNAPWLTASRFLSLVLVSLLSFALILLGVTSLVRDGSGTSHLDSISSSTRSSVARRNKFPKKCSKRDLKTLLHQLPPDDCVKYARFAFGNKCSFSYATRCPESTWVTEYFRTVRESVRTAMYVGCNKGLDTVNTLRMISNNPKYDKEKWKDLFFANRTVQPGHCSQETEPQVELAENTKPNEAFLYCVEAMPITAGRLNDTVNQLGWSDVIQVTNNAMAGFDGSAMFPNVEETVGVEGKGLADCKHSSAACKKVPVFTFDTYMQKFSKGGRRESIDYLSVDVEGYDFDVLLGAKQTLRRIRYFEFEYNWKGSWAVQKLSHAVDLFKDHGFACYFMGTQNHIWRITDCWQDHYDLRFWSNVACVNLNDRVILPMAIHMETLFQETLKLGTKLHITGMDALSVN